MRILLGCLSIFTGFNIMLYFVTGNNIKMMLVINITLGLIFGGGVYLLIGG